MADKDYVFVEITNSDNGYDFLYGAFHFGERDVASVKELVDSVLADLGTGDCIRTLTIVGHGEPGRISVGNGQLGTDTAKGIYPNNEDVWGPELDRLRCRFCSGGYVYLRGCNVGARQSGVDILEKIAAHLGCAIVIAPVGLCNGFFTTGKDQTFTPGKPKPKAIPKPKQGKKLKVVGGERVSSVAGESVAELVAFDADEIVAARYLPRVPGRPFDVRLLGEQGIELPAGLVEQFAAALSDTEPEYLPGAGFAVTGYLALEAGKRQLAPGALLGGGAFYSPLRGDTTAVYALPAAVERRIASLHAKLERKFG
jgi:hypothetical protein